MYGLSLTSLVVLSVGILGAVDAHVLARADINGFAYKSCQSAYDFLPADLGFVEKTDSALMTVELCTSTCGADFAFAGLFGSKCFCGSKFTVVSSNQDSECNTTCPGNAAQICGGLHPSATRGSQWWSLYSKTSTSAQPTTTITITVIEVNKTISTLHTTTTATIMSCAGSVTDCPLTHTATATLTMSLSTNSSSRSNSTMRGTSTTYSLTSGATGGSVISSKATLPSASGSAGGAGVGGSSTTKAPPSVTSVRSVVTIVPYKGDATAKSVGVERFGLFVAVAGLMVFL